MLNGSCLCGAVAYEPTGFAGPIGHCHCHTCRKAHSAAPWFDIEGDLPELPKGVSRATK